MIRYMDNQQETSWFVGILEGEGSFMYNLHGGARISISNTDNDIIETCEDFLKRNHVFHKIYNSQRGKRKREYEIRIQGKNDCYHLFKIIKNNFECRYSELQQILGSSETTREISLTIDLYWLIGILEAEGSFHIGCRYSRKDKPNYQPEIVISNTRFNIIDKIVKTLYGFGLSWHIHNRYPENPNHSVVKIVTISGFRRVLSILRVTEGLYVTQKAITVSNLLLEFCRSRFQQDKREPYTEQQIEIYHTLREIYSN